MAMTTFLREKVRDPRIAGVPTPQEQEVEEIIENFDVTFEVGSRTIECALKYNPSISYILTTDLTPQENKIYYEFINDTYIVVEPTEDISPLDENWYERKDIVLHFNNFLEDFVDDIIFLYGTASQIELNFINQNESSEEDSGEEGSGEEGSGEGNSEETDPRLNNFFGTINYDGIKIITISYTNANEQNIAEEIEITYLPQTFSYIETMYMQYDDVSFNSRFAAPTIYVHGKLADNNAVNTNNIIDNVVNTNKLQNNCVTTDKIRNKEVTWDKLKSELRDADNPNDPALDPYSIDPTIERVRWRFFNVS